MKPTRILIAALLALVLCTPALAQQKATLNLVTAGDQNMVDYVKDYLGRDMPRAPCCRRPRTSSLRNSQNAGLPHGR